jgi:hypothetical protein
MLIEFSLLTFFPFLIAFISKKENRFSVGRTGHYACPGGKIPCDYPYLLRLNIMKSTGYILAFFLLYEINIDKNINLCLNLQDGGGYSGFCGSGFLKSGQPSDWQNDRQNGQIVLCFHA